MMVDLWRDVVMKAVLERFSPMALKVLSDERVQGLLTQALNLQSDMRQNIEAQVKLVARTLELVTRDELSSLRQVVRNLEGEVTRLRDELEKARQAAPAPKKAAAPEPAPEPEPEPEPEPAPKKRGPGRPRK
jgi:septal ring factor EnvC (AmiA/AmiB activator)